MPPYLHNDHELGTPSYGTAARPNAGHVVGGFLLFFSTARERRRQRGTAGVGGSLHRLRRVDAGRSGPTEPLRYGTAD